MIHAHQPGSQPIDIPEVIPNPAVVPKQDPKEPAPKHPVKVPEKAPFDMTAHDASIDDPSWDLGREVDHDHLVVPVPRSLSLQPVFESVRGR